MLHYALEQINLTTQSRNNIKTSEIFNALTNHTDHQDNLDKIKDDSAFDNSQTSGTLFFPKPYNDEQREIIEKITRFNAVVVQGPPGTGKSHTISNLICHMLATGQRVLVTAKTATALSVLNKLLPENIRNLAINVSENDSKERESMKSSIMRILQKDNDRDSKRVSKQIKESQEKLDLLKEEQARVRRKLQTIVEAETYDHRIACEQYCGTITAIVQRVKQEQPKYEWFSDHVPLNSEFSLSLEKLSKVLFDTKKFHPIEEELSLHFEEVMPSEHFDNLVTQLNKIRTPNIEHLQDTTVFAKLSESSAAELNLICERIDEIKQEEKRLRSYHTDWIDRELDKVFADTTNYENLEKIENCLLNLNKLTPIYADYRITYPSEYSREQIMGVAKALKDFFNKKGIIQKLNVKLLMPSYAKEWADIFEKVKINQIPCQRNLENLEEVIGYLDFLSQLDEARYLFIDFVKIQEQSPLHQLESMEKVHGILLKLVNIQELFRKYTSIIESICETKKSEKLDDIKLICSYFLAQKDKEKPLIEINELKKQLERASVKNNSHKIMLKLLDAVKNFDVDAYRKSKLKLDDLIKKRKELIELRQTISDFNKTIPETIHAMLHSCEVSIWADRIKLLEKAWYWSQANRWVTANVNSSDVFNLKVNLEAIEKSIQSTLCQLVEARSWQFCINRLTTSQKRHIELWHQSVKKLGKGTGKYALTHIKEAQEHLDGCREAVPAWIMPLHKVWDNIQIAPDLFDVVIVDEAFQCGLEAIPLFYIAKKIIIVGDDKQVSPENIGSDRSKAQQWKKEYLEGLDSDRRDCFDIDK